MNFTIIPELTLAQRNAIPAFILSLPIFRGLRVRNITSGQDERWDGSAWVAVGGGSGSFTPLTYIAPPATNSDADQQTYILALQAEMIVKGVMTAPPAYTISGQVTGSVQNGITLELRENVSNLLVGTVTTNATGNYTFTPVVAGTYKVIPSIAGHYFTPSVPVITLSADTVQDFVSAVSTSTSEVSNTHVLVFGNNTARAVKKSPRTLLASTCAAITNSVYGVLFHNNRWFIPVFNNSAVYVYEEVGDVFTLKATITTSAIGVANPYRVFVDGAGKMAILGNGIVRFGTYSNTTETFTASGAGAINMGASLQDATYGNGKIYQAGIWGGSPLRNLSIIDMTTEVVTTQNVAAFASSAILHVAFGDGKLYVGNGSTSAIIDATTFAQIGSLVSTGGTQQGRTAFAQGRFWLTRTNVLRWIAAADASTGVATFTSLPLPLSMHGAVADGNFVYPVDNGTGRMYVVNAATAAEDGSSLVAVANAAYLRQ